MNAIVVLSFMLIAVAAGGDPSKDILSEKSCQYLKTHGYLANNTNWRALCLKTYSCNDLFSAKSCSIAKSRGECTRDSKISRMYCKLTCDNCASVASCIKSEALGMESLAIPDSMITASSFTWSSYEPKHARLNRNTGGGWAPKQNNGKEWLQVNLSNVHVVTGIATQGSAKSSEWTTRYTIQYSLNGVNFTAYQSNKVFQANTDSNTAVRHDFNPPIVAQYVRLLPQGYKSWAVVRMELYGCKRG